MTGATRAHDLDELMSVADALAEAARPAALKWFRAPAQGLENKRAALGGFDPVTRGDRDAEAAMRAVLSERRPDDAIVGEEFDAVSGGSDLAWVLDPIDGTRAFLCGLPTWGVLIGLNDGGKPFLGVMDQPFTGERFSGLSRGSRKALWRGPDGAERMLRTRPCARLSHAVMCSTAHSAFETGEDRAAYESLEAEVKLSRHGTDCYGYAMVAAGQVDMVVESGLKPYDIQAMIPIVEAAGGVITNWSGGDCSQGGRVLACGDPALHEQALERLSRA